MQVFISLFVSDNFRFFYLNFFLFLFLLSSHFKIVCRPYYVDIQYYIVFAFKRRQSAFVIALNFISDTQFSNKNLHISQ